jgi:hypothetical protein
MEWQELQQQSKQYRLQLLELDKLIKKKMTVERLVKHAQHEIEKYTADLQQARNQLDKLEGFSFINLFREWSGKKDELLEQNLDRVAVTELKLIETQLTLEDLQDDLVDIIQKVNAINEAYIEQQLHKINEQKQLYIMQHAPQIAEKLTALTEQELLCKQLIIEIQEAIEAGGKALSTLTDAGYALHEASNYSTWDTFLGGGLIATALKHNKLEVSNSQLHLAQIALQRFSNELLDIKDFRQDALTIESDGFVKFTDYFFDNIFTDWSIHSKISTSMNQISRVQDDVSNTLSNLEQKLMLTMQKETGILRQKEEILSADGQALFFEK